ncbi:MAG: hypothetical protein PHR16_10215 [Methylovulum sp.]|nr:hypothetical protein [Methylovulum sp.]
MQYDGSGKLGDAIAALYGCSPRSHNKIAELVGEAKESLGITSKAKKLPDTVRLAIYRWHVERFDPVQNVKQAEPDGTVQDIKQDNAVYDFKQTHFALTVASKRTTIMLEGYLVGALQRKHGLTDNAAIRVWIEKAIKADGARFDSDAPLTRQVKRIIIESFV